MSQVELAFITYVSPRSSPHFPFLFHMLFSNSEPLDYPHGCGFSRGRTARSGSLSWGAREVGSPCEWRGGARHCSRVMGGESGLETCWRRSLEVFLGLRQETLASLDLCRWPQGASHGGSEKSGKLEVGGASRDSTLSVSSKINMDEIISSACHIELLWISNERINLKVFTKNKLFNFIVSQYF